MIILLLMLYTSFETVSSYLYCTYFALVSRKIFLRKFTWCLQALIIIIIIIIARQITGEFYVP